MHVAIFADVHGKLDLLFRLVARWEQENRTPIDLVLQAGDLAVFPDHARIDSATARHARNDPTQLGVRDFIVGTAQTAATLARTAAHVVFVRGNHEDHTWLDQREQHVEGPVFPIDAAGRVHCLRTGVPWTFDAPDGTSLRILGIGRIAATKPNPPLRHIQPAERKLLHNLPSEHIDLLLTHDSIAGSVFPNSGMPEIATAIQAHAPIYHAFGHVGDHAIMPTTTVGSCLSFKAADLHWDQAGMLHTPPFAVLHWQHRQEHRLEWIDASWLVEYGRWTWENS